MDEMDKTELDDQSMDEMYELPDDDDLEASVDTLASPTKRALHDSDDDDDDALVGRRPLLSHNFSQPASTGDGRRQAHDGDDSDNDEPPEIPGSPMKPVHAPSYLSNERRGPDIFVVNHTDDDASSSEDEEDEYEHDKASTKARSTLRSQERQRKATTVRSKDTVLSLVTPHDDEPPSSVGKDASSPRRTVLDAPLPKIESPSKEMARAFYDEMAKEDATDAAQDLDERTLHDNDNDDELALPPEIQTLLELVDVFRPEMVDLPLYLEPFVPPYLPSIGFPFDTTSLLRPDVLVLDPPPVELGVHLLAEPSAAQSSPAELQLLLQADAKTALGDSRRAIELPVHVIEEAHLAPSRISAWMASVAVVHASQPPPHVVYTKPMPSLDTLLELWPPEIEPFLTGFSTLELHTLSLEDRVRVICGLLDIPVYPGQLKQSLHVLFVLYQECMAITANVRVCGC
ncbi:hypothetical protein SDRG_13083 [Saprolegnia diclina VS20]|uniref:Intraflagellar transport protein 46 homolog n=1 Tax=Saprolegnia diclina (strain VS20) TaxID=1156394 RepID=T0Q6W4_SAPDV|nr:hypothetical protein SDRG_13083 [Saprolegnia diclina VS20]EQC29210.1 hypothetical protein SDRG_13083 [Saprolegnia diclina VS20]|eukprot:XP_008617388.1 hypothetical protein SDRG_13083 [Saprolegnia diclina VS20]